MIMDCECIHFNENITVKNKNTILVLHFSVSKICMHCILLNMNIEIRTEYTRFSMVEFA